MHYKNYEGWLTKSSGLLSKSNATNDDRFWKIFSDNCAMLQLAKFNVFSLCVWTIGTFDCATFLFAVSNSVANPRAFVNSWPCNGCSVFDVKSMWCNPGNFENSWKPKQKIQFLFQKKKKNHSESWPHSKEYFKFDIQIVIQWIHSKTDSIAESDRKKNNLNKNETLTSVLTMVSIWLSFRNNCRNSLQSIRSLTLSVFNWLWLKFSWTVWCGRFFGICTECWWEQSTKSSPSVHLQFCGHFGSLESGTKNKYIKYLFKTLNESSKKNAWKTLFFFFLSTEFRNLSNLCSMCLWKHTLCDGCW